MKTFKNNPFKQSKKFEEQQLATQVSFRLFFFSSTDKGSANTNAFQLGLPQCLRNFQKEIRVLHFCKKCNILFVLST